MSKTWYHIPMSKLSFETKPYTIESWLIVHVPPEVSKQLPSRGIGMATGTINGHSFTAPLEPDGNWSHWFNIDEELQRLAGIREGDTVSVTFEPAKDWPLPELPKDFVDALKKAPKAQDTWAKVTPKAQWEWVRWIRSTKQAETRTRHVQVAISKLSSGMRRPCCFNSNMCTVMDVSKNGVLLTPIHA